MALDDLRLFTLSCGRAYGERVAKRLGVALAAHEERDFEDGEHKIRPLESVRGRHAVLLQALNGEPGLSANDKLCRALFLIGALRDASASRVTLLAPYLAYSRKDRRTQPRDPVTTRYVAQMLEAVGVDHVVTLDVHNLAAFQNAFRCRTDHLEATRLFVAHFAPLARERDIAVVSPDAGGVKRAEAFRQALVRALERPVPLALMEKQRAHGVVSGDLLVGAVEGRLCVILDDLISTGTTLVRAARALRANGALEVHAAATHGVFQEAANEALADPALAGIVVTDTIAAHRLRERRVLARLTVLDSTALVAEAIRRLHEGGSLVELLA